jgi:hypothetical protein
MDSFHGENMESKVEVEKLNARRLNGRPAYNSGVGMV